MTTIPRGRLGILGGMGPQATLAFYQRILDLTQAERDQEHLPTLIWSDTHIPDRTTAILGGQTQRVYSALLSGARLLEREGCTVLAVPCNTSHYFADRLQGALGIPLLNMVRLAAEAAKTNGWERVGILGTEGTIQSALYQTECALLGIHAVVPDQAGQAIINSVIYDEIKRGRTGHAGQLDGVLAQLRTAQCDGVILACTELSVFRLSHGLPEFCTDAMDVLAEACVTACGYPLHCC